MDLTNLENALNSGDFQEQVYRSLEGIYQISKVLNQLDLLKNFSDHDLEIVEKIKTIENALAGYETSELELKALLNTQLQSVRVSEEEKLTQAASNLKARLIEELTQAKDNLAQVLKPQIQGVMKFLKLFVYGRQSFFRNESDNFIELFEFGGTALQANKSYLVQFNMPYELSTDGIYGDLSGEMILCLKANSKVWPILNSFYQNKTADLTRQDKIIDTYRANCIFKTPSEQANYKIAVFSRKHKGLWINVNYTNNTEGFEPSFLNSASFNNYAPQSIPTTYSNDWVFYKHSQAIIYEISQ